MRRKSRLWGLFLGSALLLGLVGAERLLAEEAVAGGGPAVNIAGELAVVKAGVEKQDFKAVWEHCHAILKAVEAREASTLSGPDQFAIGVAHYYLMAEAFDKALAAGKLTPDEKQFAQSVRDEVMAPPPDIQVISRGEQIKLEDYIAEGKTTIVDFFSQYCGPCMRIAPALEQLAMSRRDVRLVKVDINRPGVRGIDWASPVAQQFGLSSIPHFRIYGPDKKLAAEGERAKALIQQWTEQ